MRAYFSPSAPVLAISSQRIWRSSSFSAAKADTIAFCLSAICAWTTSRISAIAPSPAGSVLELTLVLAPLLLQVVLEHLGLRLVRELVEHA